MRASSHDQSLLQFSIQSKIGLKILGAMNDYQGILSGVAQKVYQKYIQREKTIEEKENKAREKRRAKLDARQKRISQQQKRANLHRKKSVKV